MMRLIHYSLLFILGSASGNRAWIDAPSVSGGAWTEAKVSSPAMQPLISLESTNANVGIPLPEPPSAVGAEKTKDRPLRTEKPNEPLCPNPCQHTCIACQNIPCSRNPDDPCKPKYVLNGQDVSYLCMLAEVHQNQKKQTSLADSTKPSEKAVLEQTPEKPMIASASETDPSVSFLVNNLLTTMSEIVAADQKANSDSQMTSSSSAKSNSAESTENFNTGSVSVGSPSSATSHFSSVLSSSSNAAGPPSPVLASSSSSTDVRSSTSTAGSASSASGAASGTSSVGSQASPGTVVVVNQDDMPFPFFQMHPPWYLQQQQLHQLRQQEFQQQMLQHQLQQQQLQQQQHHQQLSTNQNRLLHHLVQPSHLNSVLQSQANSVIHLQPQANSVFSPRSQVNSVFHSPSRVNSVFHPRSQVNSVLHSRSQVNSMFHPRSQISSTFFPRSQAMTIQTNVIRLPSTFANRLGQFFANTNLATDASRLNSEHQIRSFDDSISVINNLPSFIL